MLGSVLVSILRSYLKVSIVESVPWSAIGSVDERMLVSILANLLVGEYGNILGVHLEAS
jgi:hypothetical protein